MTTSSKIKSEIKNVVQNYKPADYSLWTIGITSELETVKKLIVPPKIGIIGKPAQKQKQE